MTLSKQLVGAAVGMAFLMGAGLSQAQAKEMDPMDLTIGDVVVTEISDEVLVGNESLRFANPTVSTEPENAAAEVEAAAVIFDQIVNLGQKMWRLVEEGRPVVSTRWATASALPEGIQNWFSMSGWDNPRARVYRVEYKNLYGITVVDFSFRVTYTAGGSFQGKGQYLSRVSVEPASVLVRWGYQFDATAEVANVVNVGSSSSPIGGMELLLRWKVSTVMNEVEQTASYFVRGDGAMVDLTRGN
jgi:hypothetical protein